MEDFKNHSEEKGGRWRDRRSSRSSQIWTGLFILLIGLVALIRVTVGGVPHWVFSWQMLLIGLGLFIGVRHGFRGAAWFILLLVGGVFLVNEINPNLTFQKYLWPVALIAVGAFIVLRPRRRFCGVDEKKNISSADPFVKSEIEMKFSAQPTYSSEDYVDSTSIFGGAKKIIISKNFKGGDLVNIFGGTELDLTQADFNGIAEVELTTIFGGTKLVIPSNWAVRSDAVTIFGGLEDKRNMQAGIIGSEKTLILKGTVIFGGIEIKS